MFFYVFAPIQNIYFPNSVFDLFLIFLLLAESLAVRFQSAFLCFLHDKYTVSAVPWMMCSTPVMFVGSQLQVLRNTCPRFLINLSDKRLSGAMLSSACACFRALRTELASRATVVSVEAPSADPAELPRIVAAAARIHESAARIHAAAPSVEEEEDRFVTPC
jgi:hypothetical protein